MPGNFEDRDPPELEIDDLAKRGDLRHAMLETRVQERDKFSEELRALMHAEIGTAYERLHELLILMFAEKDRALSMAADEREKSAQVLRDEQHRAATLAESEREKAAQALAGGLERSIREGDDRLREHILNQVEQIRSALKSSDLLEVERIAKVEALVRGGRDELLALIDANTREYRAIHEASQKAVQKAEEAQQRFNESQNESRGALSDLTATLMPRKESEARHEEMTRQLRELRDDMGKLRTDQAVGPAGLDAVQARLASDTGRREGSSSIVAALVAAAALVIAASGVIVAILTSR